MEHNNFAEMDICNLTLDAEEKGEDEEDTELMNGEWKEWFWYWNMHMCLVIVEGLTGGGGTELRREREREDIYTHMLSQFILFAFCKKTMED